jgi:hypothetical protein
LLAFAKNVERHYPAPRCPVQDEQP